VSETFSRPHFLGIEGLHPFELNALLDRADQYADRNLEPDEKRLDGKLVINLFYENSTRTRGSFEVAAKRLGADVINMGVEGSSVAKGETLIDTAITLNAMKPQFLVVRHNMSGAVKLLSRKVEARVINGGDGRHEHPTQALLDALTIRRHFGSISGLIVTIIGDIAHSRVARSNALLLIGLGAQVRFAGPPTLVPKAFEQLGVRCFTRLDDALAGADVVMPLRVQRERMNGSFIPSEREFFARYGINRKRLDLAAPEAVVMHPGPMNRGVEIDSDIADDPERSLIREQVQLGVAARMAVFDLLSKADDPRPEW